MDVISKVLNLFKKSDNSFDNWTLGVDTSKWNGNINWPTMVSKNVRFGITKATDIGSATHEGFVDEKAYKNYNGMKVNGVLTGGYCWLDPQYKDGEYQAKYYLDNFYNGHVTDLPPVLDFEDKNVISWTDMLWRAQRWLETVEKETGRISIVYTSPGYMGNFPQSKSGWLSRYPLWVAHYIERSYPTVPYPWKDWTIWQYSDKGHYPYYIYRDPLPGRGKEYGCDSYYLDMNWFQGTFFDLLAFCNLAEPSPPMPLPPEESVLFEAKCLSYALSIRSGPGTSHHVVGYLRSGDVVKVYEVRNGWYRIKKDGSNWVFGSPLYIEKIEDEDSDDGNILFKAECVAHALSIRSGPSTAYSVRGYLSRGNVVNVYEERNNWLKISENENKWCSGHPQYMKKL